MNERMSGENNTQEHAERVTYLLTEDEPDDMERILSIPGGCQSVTCICTQLVWSDIMKVSRCINAPNVGNRALYHRPQVPLE